MEDASMEIWGKAAGSSTAAHLVWVFGVEREENRDGGRETWVSTGAFYDSSPETSHLDGGGDK